MDAKIALREALGSLKKVERVVAAVQA